MAKILVADDNSNIQKMVGLALRDQGIEVIAVGNGEAAVRKISDIRPDLVLADVFMPVRNGYEVCEYVKTDTKLAHIPVILLVGAFDPLDEQEAQRVGADGVLKKPFVPPDPLISMVKSALQRAGVSLVPEPAVTPEAAAPPRLPTFGSRKDGLAGGAPLASIPLAVVGNDSGNEMIEHHAAPVTFPEGNQAPVFGSLLDTQEGNAHPENETDPNLQVAHHPEFDADRSWNSPAAAKEVEEEEEEKHNSWRSDFEGEETAPPAGPNGASDWRETVMASLPASVQRELEPDRIPRENSGRGETIPAEIDLETAPVAAVPVASGREEAWGSTTTLTPTGAPASAGEAPVTEPTTGILSEEETAAEAPGGAWFSVPANPWEAELQKAQHLSETWNAPAESPEIASASAPAVVEAATPAITSETPSSFAYTAEPAAVEMDAPEPHAPSITETPAPVEAASAPAVQPAAPAPTADEAMEAVVAKVLAKISPEMMQAMTREILRPVVEAIVKGEIDSKKS